MKITRLLIIIIALAALATAVDARTVKTTRRLPAKTSVKSAIVSDHSAPFDTIIPTDGIIEVAGYDKPLRSRIETMFVTNRSNDLVRRLIFTIQYLDTDGRQLHLRHCNVDADLPPGDTRKVDIQSWDRQQSFYYIGSRRPRSSAIPYDIKLRIDTIIVVSRDKQSDL